MSRRTLWAFAVAVVIIVACVIAVQLITWRGIDALRLTATTAVPRVDAITRLATYHDRRAVRALLQIAQSPRAASENQEFAVRALGRSGDPTVGDALAGMLRLNEGLAMREAISLTLTDLPCSRQCAEKILLYLERRFGGEKTPEENIDGKIDPDVRKNKEIEDRLQSVLARDKETLKDVLGAQYGITNGALAPSPFGITIATRLSLQSLCPQIQSSSSELRSVGAKNAELLQLLAYAGASLRCPQK